MFFGERRGWTMQEYKKGKKWGLGGKELLQRRELKFLGATDAGALSSKWVSPFARNANSTVREPSALNN